MVGVGEWQDMWVDLLCAAMDQPRPSDELKAAVAALLIATSDAMERSRKPVLVQKFIPRRRQMLDALAAIAQKEDGWDVT